MLALRLALLGYPGPACLAGALRASDSVKYPNIKQLSGFFGDIST